MKYNIKEFSGHEKVPSNHCSVCGDFCLYFFYNKVDAQQTPDHVVLFLGNHSIIEESPIEKCMSTDRVSSAFRFPNNPRVTEVKVAGSGSSLCKIRMIDATDQDHHRSLVPITLLIRTSTVTVVVCSYNDLNSFKLVTHWINVVKEYNQYCRIVIVADHAEIESPQRAFNASSLHDMKGADYVLEVSSDSEESISNVKKAIIDQCNLCDQKAKAVGGKDINDTLF